MTTDQRNSINLGALLLLVAGTLVLFVLNLFIGSVNISFSDIWNALFHSDNVSQSIRTIIIEYRLPQAVTALIAGGALSVAGLLMQTLFRNPLADPSILGISSGAGLGVAVIVLLSGSAVSLRLWSTLGVSLSALLGAMAVLLLMIAFGSRFRNKVSLILIGLMISYFAGSITDILKFFSHKEEVHSFVIWGLGSFANVGLDKLGFVVGAMLVGIIPCFFITKSLNLMLLGDRYAENLGLNIRRSNTIVILLSGYLTAIVTAFCGPIAFLGLAVPHLARLMFRTSDHRKLVPTTLLTGMNLALLCNLIARLPIFNGGLPINAITAIIGAPIVIWIIINRQNIR